MLISISAIQCLTSPKKSTEKLAVIDNFDLKKFTQHSWYEIARIPIPIGSDWIQTKSTYKLVSENEIHSLYEGISPSGERKTLNGKAKIKSNGFWKISYIPLLYSDYKIIKLTEDYKNVMVTSGTIDYLWIMCVEPKMEDKIYNDFLNFASANGFPIDKLEKVQQSK